MTDGSRSGRRGTGWRRLLGLPEHSPEPSDLGADPADDEAECVHICDCAEGPEGRRVVTVRGTLRTVGERTVGGLPALEAELDDGSDSLSIVWMGRRSIAGIQPGRDMIVSGRLVASGGRSVLFNPRYELKPLGTE
ncbi:OB-fold nucleic acid binding domain-containing protein [Streptomyces sp. ST2-7A]|uniref:OB-fold nucleic acid binding domain-containing protein n=1 Tax=Streptomyces sp. ST2-7A TaxID=2907214 RepID=UPI001F2CA7F4|nr:OB-fold nucleic acid binding domain-containing protein [Streptomyces sp. ST2-7A]MCE7081271.1 OB-fold nucleic acid binding domain-containing protein [Streptomyces sp. ST2-7A]